MEDPDITFRLVKNYSLRAAGTMKNIAAQRLVKHAQQLRTEHDQTMEQHWADGAKASEKDDADDDEAAAAVVEATKEPTFVPKTTTSSNETTVPPSSTSVVDDWSKRLSRQIEMEFEKMKTRRRYTAHLTPDELRLVMKAWALLETRIHPHGDPSSNEQEAVRILARELDISERRAETILQGDPYVRLSTKDKDEILHLLEPWVLEQQQSSSWVFPP